MADLELTADEIRGWIQEELGKRGVPSSKTQWMLVWKTTAKVSFFGNHSYRTFSLGDPDLLDKAYEFYYRG